MADTEEYGQPLATMIYGCGGVYRGAMRQYIRDKLKREYDLRVNSGNFRSTETGWFINLVLGAGILEELEEDYVKGLDDGKIDKKNDEDAQYLLDLHHFSRIIGNAGRRSTHKLDKAVIDALDKIDAIGRARHEIAHPDQYDWTEEQAQMLLDDMNAILKIVNQNATKEFEEVREKYEVVAHGMPLIVDRKVRELLTDVAKNVEAVGKGLEAVGKGVEVTGKDVNAVNKKVETVSKRTEVIQRQTAVVRTENPSVGDRTSTRRTQYAQPAVEATQSSTRPARPMTTNSSPPRAKSPPPPRKPLLSWKPGSLGAVPLLAFLVVSGAVALLVIMAASGVFDPDSSGFSAPLGEPVRGPAIRGEANSSPTGGAGGQTQAGESAPAPEPVIYIVQPGDQFKHIAAEFGLTTRELWDHNPHIENPDLIHPGDEIRIPPAEAGE